MSESVEKKVLMDNEKIEKDEDVLWGDSLSKSDQKGEKRKRRSCREWYQDSQCIQTPISKFLQNSKNAFTFFCYLKFFGFFSLILFVFMFLFALLNTNTNKNTNDYQLSIYNDPLYKLSIHSKPNFKVALFLF
jgi:hypothetical protein